MRRISRFRGCLLGLAAGDAVGTTNEFREPGTFPSMTDMVGGGPFNLAAGEWTDDTSMALCLAESLLERRGFNAEDQMRRYIRWYREGYMSVKGRCFDIGTTTRLALLTFEETGHPYSWEMDLERSGNGSLMRLAAVPLLYSWRPEEAIERCGESSRTTHSTVEAVDACRYFGGLIVGAVNGVEKETLLGPRWCPVDGYWESSRLTDAVDVVASGSFKLREPPVIRGTGHVVRCLEAALWAFQRSMGFREGCLLAANLGDDADTTSAVYGQIAGAYYGEEAIPAEWRVKLAMREKILDFADRLYHLSVSSFK